MKPWSHRGDMFAFARAKGLCVICNRKTEKDTIFCPDCNKLYYISAKKAGTGNVNWLMDWVNQQINHLIIVGICARCEQSYNPKEADYLCPGCRQ